MVRVDLAESQRKPQNFPKLPLGEIDCDFTDSNPYQCMMYFFIGGLIIIEFALLKSLLFAMLYKRIDCRN